jgi:hypothetical protein
MTLAVTAEDNVMKPVGQGFDRIAPEHVAPLVVYLASERCRFTGRVFGIEAMTCSCSMAGVPGSISTMEWPAGASAAAALTLPCS